MTVKRCFDIILSGCGLLMLFPFFIVIGIIIKKNNGGPVFYRGERVGLHRKPFRIYKFRTMVVNAENIGPSSTSKDDPRITNIGRFLRKYKLDELPQLINVLTGDMSFVGPRPQVQWAVDLYTSEERQILTIRPGITDYASLCFADEDEILKGSPDPDKDYMEKIHPEKMRLSLEYVKNHSFWGDIKIILLTLVRIFRI